MFRFIAGLSSLIGVVCLYKVLTKFADIFTVLCGLLFFVTTRFFFEFSCSIHSHSYNIMYVGLFLLFFFKAVDDDANSLRYWIGCWIVLFICSLTSYEFILYLSAFAGIYIILNGKLKKHYLALLLLASAPFLAVSLHFLQNCWAVGLDNALADNLGFNRRHGGLVPQRFLAMAQLPYILHTKTTEYLSLSWIVMMVTVGISPLLLKKSKVSEKWGIILWACLAASSTWYIFMPSHASVHKHTVSQLMLLLIITAGLIVSSLWRIVADRELDKPARYFAFLVLAGVIGLHSCGAGYSVFKHLYANKYSAVKTLKVLGGILPECSGILVNSMLEGPHLTFYTGQAVKTVYRVGSLKRKIESLQNATSQEIEQFYFVYGLYDGYMNDDLFIELASKCQGYQKTLTYTHNSVVKNFFLFDLTPIIDTDVSLPDSKAAEQLEGRFLDWPSFQD